MGSWNVDDFIRGLRERTGAVDRGDLLQSYLEANGPNELLVRLKDESERFQSIDPHTSLLLADALIDAAEIARQPIHRALGFMAKGDALRYLGNYPESLAFFERAGSAFLIEGDE